MTARKKMARPSMVKVGPYLYDIIYRHPVSDSEELYGLTINRDHRIIVGTDQSDLASKDTLLHELLHAVMWTSGAFRHVGDEEQVVTVMATCLLGVLRDNPELVAHLTS